MAQIEIINFAAYFGKGAKTQHSDKIWFNAKIDGTLVSGWSRRNCTPSFKTRAGIQGAKDAQNKWEEKIGGRKDGGDVYTIVSNPQTQKLLCPNLHEDLVSHYYSKMAKGQLKKG